MLEIPKIVGRIFESRVNPGSCNTGITPLEHRLYDGIAETLKHYY